MNAQIFLDFIKHDDKIHWVDLKYTQKIISHLDQENKENAVFIILGAWDVDNLRYDIKFQDKFRITANKKNNLKWDYFFCELFFHS